MKTINMPLEEYNRDMDKAQQKGFAAGYDDGQKAYLNIIEQIVLKGTMENCTILWGRLKPQEKEILNNLIAKFIANPPAQKPPTIPVP